MRTKAELAEVELVPFKSLIDNDIATIMTGHMALPEVTGDDTPCSLSRKITTDLLRDELGFKGVIVTDCLEMEAVAEKYGFEGGAVMALEAGADVVMICHRMDRQQGALEATYAAVQEGRLSIEDLRASGKRIAALKNAFTDRQVDFMGGKTVDMKHWAEMKQQHIALSNQVYASAMTVLHKSDHSIPLHHTGGVVVVFTPRMESVNLAVDDAEGVLRDSHGRLRNTAGPSYYAFAAAVAQRTPAQHIVYAPEAELSQIEEERLQTATAVVFLTRNAFDQGSWQMDCLRRVHAKIGRRRFVVVSTCAPYDVLEVADSELWDGAVCATMEFTVPAMKAMVQVIFGEAEAQGSLPVHCA